jgi:hypothetical protein
MVVEAGPLWPPSPSSASNPKRALLAFSHAYEDVACQHISINNSVPKTKQTLVEEISPSAVLKSRSERC